ncbi:hypothetical protein SAMN04488543_0454 [Friedmanniella luteola]|uniref:Uncharacterized protein n=1 Tax=Friedmanniella luteola TaxID=546871 RepID=A0A1H1LVL4_9ACTN|nr:hypothetical protein [Friedmanniella luteola]SDR78420.1 hypothetical protein SAMN04488543_0454 [Friedmanniella luteola]
MSSPAAPPPPGRPWSAATTDPGLDAVESLYRGATGRSGLRAFEPALRPPEGTLDHSWLFRPDQPAASPRAATAGDATTGAGRALLTTTSGLAVLTPAPAVRWSPTTRPAARRWPAAALLAGGLGCALLLLAFLTAR